jgi:hypothetical protein
LCVKPTLCRAAKPVLFVCYWLILGMVADQLGAFRIGGANRVLSALLRSATATPCLHLAWRVAQRLARRPLLVSRETVAESGPYRRRVRDS